MKKQACLCQRCGGMIVENYADLVSPIETGEAVFGWRCVNCGEYVDRQVLLNRSAQEQATYVPPRAIQHRSIPQLARPIQAHRRTEAA